MGKKIVLILMALTLSVTSFAQFENGKKYLSATLSGLNVDFTGAEKWKFDIAARGGYMVWDNWMALATVGYSYRKEGRKSFTIGAGARYYVIQNGLYLGLGADYQHLDYGGNTVDDFMPNIHIGYAFFLSKTVTIEPELYYKQSLNDHSNYSDAGFRIGIGVYLDEVFPKLK